MTTWYDSLQPPLNNKFLISSARQLGVSRPPQKPFVCCVQTCAAMRTVLVAICLFSTLYCVAEGCGGSGNAHSVPECRAIIDRGFTLVNCPNYGPCASEVHTLAEKCTELEKQNPKSRECHHRVAVKTPHMEWFKLTCQWQDALSKCMAGEQIPQSVAGFRFKRNSNLANPTMVTPTTPRECWQQVSIKIAECKRLGAECDHYSVCAGDQEDVETPGDNQAGWYEHVASLKQRTHEQMREYHAALQSCMRESAMMADPPAENPPIEVEITPTITAKPKKVKPLRPLSSESLESSSSEEN